MTEPIGGGLSTAEKALTESAEAITTLVMRLAKEAS